MYALISKVIIEAEKNNDRVTITKTIMPAPKLPCKMIKPSKLVKDLIIRFFVYLIYSLLGAGIFMLLENKALDEEKYITDLKIAQSFVEGNLTQLRLNNSLCSANLTNKELLASAEEIVQAASRLPEKLDKWAFGRGWQLTFEICTTIGYGSTPPKTQDGRLFCVFYTIFGIPIFILFLRSVGEVINRNIAKCVYWADRKLYGTTEEPKNLELKVLIGFCCALAITVFVAAIFKSPDKTYIDSVYSVIITYTTVGFGDMMLSNTAEVVVGLSLVSAVLDGVGVYLEKLEEERRKQKGKGCCKCFGNNKSSVDEDAYGMDNKARDVEAMPASKGRVVEGEECTTKGNKDTEGERKAVDKSVEQMKA